MEYWITEDGSSIFCDGDAGIDVPNHEMVVKHRCIMLAIQEMQASDNDLVQRLIGHIESFADDDCVDTVALRSAILDESDSIYQGMDENERHKHAELYDDPFEWMRKQCGISARWTWECAWSDKIDERAHAKKHWGWIRVAGNCAEMIKLTRKDLKRLAEGLYDAFGDAVESMEFNVEAGDKYHAGVPYSIIESANLTYFRQLCAVT